MENFVVSARKYRPQNFSSVVGQEHITTTLKNAINNNQLAHAFLFCGPRGVGKTTCARILAKTINCENRTPEGEACNACVSCTNFEKGMSLNIHELDAASNNSVDDIRALVEQVRFAPQGGLYKVYIIDEVHMLSAAAFNAFLKTLEEPPSYAIFILATTEKHKILPTILSRCQIFDFKRITHSDTTKHLKEIADKENIKAEKTALHLIAQKSEGCMRDSLSILDKIVSFTDGNLTYENTLEHLNILDEDYFFKMVDYNYKGDASETLLLFNEIINKGFEPDTFIEGYQEFLRNLLVSADKKAVSLLEVPEDFKTKYLSVAREIAPAWIVSGLNILTEAAIANKQAKNKKLHTELMLIKLAYLNQAIELAGGSSGVQKLPLAAQKPVSFRKLSIVPVKEKAASKTGKIAEAKEPGVYVKQEKKTEVKEVSPAVIEPKEKPGNINYQENSKPTAIGSLKKLRAKVAESRKKENRANALEYNLENLQAIWEEVAARLESQNLLPAASAFKTSKLKILDDENFEVEVMHSIQQKFIEAEKSDITERLYSSFPDKTIRFSFNVPQVEKTEDDAPIMLTAMEQLKLMMEDNPHVRDLKDSLNLYID